ncbi:hypothetical protein [Methylobacterium sp. E-045]|uniref:hypothetical protein n=1 Tax=Methylobacterium sp. E-045 TaxID=2836575 RepID=UPI0028BEED07|nr:hypothetical protein [Methylobacterium sp. E-045]
MTVGVDGHELRHIIASLSAGMILVEPDRTIAHASEAALAPHGAEPVGEPGGTEDDYRERVALRYRHSRNRYPMERVVTGDRDRTLHVDTRSIVIVRRRDNGSPSSQTSK